MAVAISVALSLGLAADDAIILQDSNRLTLRLLPCDVLARVTRADKRAAQLEIELARRLASSGSPVAAVEPLAGARVYELDGLAVTLWTYYEPASRKGIPPAGYASALKRLHTGLRQIDIRAPHFTDRVSQAQQLVASRDRTPALDDADRELLASTLQRLKQETANSGAAEQLLHGEPHPGNLLTTNSGLLFIDFETCCRGPVEFDLAHAPEEVSGHYPGVSRGLLRDCRVLVLAMITACAGTKPTSSPTGASWEQNGFAGFGQRLTADDRGRPLGQFSGSVLH